MQYSAFSSVLVCMKFRLVSPRSAQVDLWLPWVDGFALVAIFHNGNTYLLVLIKVLAEEPLESLVSRFLSVLILNDYSDVDLCVLSICFNFLMIAEVLNV